MLQPRPLRTSTSPGTSLGTPLGTRARGWLAPLVVAVAAWLMSQLVPLLSPLLVGLAVGAIVVNTPLRRVVDWAPAAGAAKTMLRLGIALLGLRLAIADVASLGVLGAVVIFVTVATTFKTTQYVGRRLGVDDDLVQLIAAGFSICGAAAIAAVQDSIRARQQDVAVALALVTAYGTVMMLAIPFLGTALGLSPAQTALWAGASIHEVAQVVAAAAIIGGGSTLAIAMGIKLGRVMMLVPVHHSVIRAQRASAGVEAGHRAGIPWFLWAFAAAVAVRATGFVPAPALEVANAASTILLGAGMFGLGLGLALRDLWPIPLRAVGLATVATATATTVPLVLLVLG